MLPSKKYVLELLLLLISTRLSVVVCKRKFDPVLREELERELYNFSSLLDRSTPLSVPSSSVTILSIGSIERKSYQILQNSTIGSMINILFFTEENTEPCRVCNGTNPYPLTKRRAYLHKPFDWWCAQKRPLSAIVEFMDKNTAPDFVLVVDDDTAIHPKHFLQFVSSLDPSLAFYMGDAGTSRKSDFVNGGGGWLVSRALLLAMKKVDAFRVCLKKQQGGPWCMFHSDWVVGLCIRETLGVRPSNRRGIFLQSSMCSNVSVSCHQLGRMQQYCEYYIKIVGIAQEHLGDTCP